MKKLFAVLVVLVLYQHWGDIQNTFKPPPDFSAMHPEGVVLYATEWCGYCKKTREFFNQHHIAFIEYDIEKSAVGRDQYDQLHSSGIPVVVIKGEVLRGYNPSEMQRLLNL